MKSRLLLLALPLALAACGGSGNTANSSTPAASPLPAVPAPAGQDWTQVVHKTDEGYVMGNPNAPIKLVEYGSRLCPACGAFAREGFEPLTNNYVKSGKVSWEFREFLIHGAPDLPPALLGICQGETIFFPLLEQMYQAQQGFNDKLQAMPPAMQQQLQNAKPVDAIKAMAEQMDLINFVKQRGIPEAKARQCLADMTQIDRLTKQTQDRGADGTVTGTPTFILNGQPLKGAISWSDVQAALKNAGA
ncbi:putative lipoprotein [Sphingomonas sp. S17]|uniref:Thioredoxin domain-containing protein n=2 Tax=Sphingomonas paucimobilis TaxID=13689 RepID=A0A411LIS1_SPHPI|nr:MULTISPECIES: thioredoxin domain-containing protein [Sphingomonas]EGI54628.1 putative lipoprotein [Sphingomonas sp. S17]MBQ1478816.1 thioredoxin domain-containing protein [Sphingomonas sp.]MCM3678309.1 DsbA family protein [Sphingomonas paucimobilis]MDG5969297.1 thioredoxin domain-containing protein [Sphingomonas paucimobilis]NNG57084.1 thioredoxin domain-containing protein [Sphingomonas paucimobilis]